MPALLQAFQSNDPMTRQFTINAVGEIVDGVEGGSREAVAALIEVLNDKRDNGKQNAVDALGRIGEPASSAIPALLKSLSDKDAAVRLERDRRFTANWCWGESRPSHQPIAPGRSGRDYAECL